MGNSLQGTSQSPASDSPKTLLAWGMFAVSGIVSGESELPQHLTISQTVLVSKDTHQVHSHEIGPGVPD